MSDLREPHERPDTCSAAELADILDRFIALPSTEAIFKAAAKKLRALSADTPQPILDNSHRDAVKAALRYAIRGATMNGKEMDFDPDALVLNAAYALCGPAGGAVLPCDAPPIEKP